MTIRYNTTEEILQAFRLYVCTQGGKVNGRKSSSWYTRNVSRLLSSWLSFKRDLLNNKQLQFTIEENGKGGIEVFYELLP